MGLAAVDERIRARVCWRRVWRRNGLRQQSKLLGHFTGSKPCKTEKNSNPRADLCSAARKLIRSSKVVTPAWCDVDIKLGKQAKISPNILSSSSPYKENTSH
jgi:hypothetical protein